MTPGGRRGAGSPPPPFHHLLEYWIIFHHLFSPRSSRTTFIMRLGVVPSTNTGFLEIIPNPLESFMKFIWNKGMENAMSEPLRSPFWSLNGLSCLISNSCAVCRWSNAAAYTISALTRISCISWEESCMHSTILDEILSVVLLLKRFTAEK